tara:strand:+ start:770 stop:985 length:216 start_codon:yes stop_codon:yes gene_type:complete
MPLSRWSKRHKKTFGKKKEKWDGNFRLPPKPDSYYTKTKGSCRWCGNVILKEDIQSILEKHGTQIVQMSIC